MVEIDLSALQLSVREIAIRLGVAMMIGGVIGMEREFSHRPAGLRTHMLVALGACAVMITSQLLFCQYRPYGVTPDPARLSAQVIAGVGFLGAGTILREGAIVKGLTTAASIWSVACLGIAVGAGYYSIALISAGFILVTLTIVEWLQRRVFRNRFNRFAFTVKCTNVVTIIGMINQQITSKDARVGMFQAESIGEGLFEINFNTDFAGRHAQSRYQSFLAEIMEAPFVVSVKSEKI